MTLALTLAVAFAVHVRTHETDVDASLRSSWEHAATELQTSGMPMHGATLTAPTQAANAATATWLLAGGAALATGDDRDALLATFDPSSVADGLQDTALAGGRVRSFAGDVPQLAGARLVLAASMSAFDAGLRSLALILGLMGAGGIAVAAGIGWLLSARALRPIATMSETASAIALSRGFSRRIAVRDGGRDELSGLGRTFNHMLASLEEAYGRQQRFVADVSHELRTPLTAIQGDLELLSRAQLPQNEVAATLTEARAEARRLARLVDDLLVLARADAGPQPLVGKPVQLDEVVMDVFRELRGHAGSRLSVDALDPVVVEGEPDRLKQLVLILVDNALRYTPAPGVVRLSLRHDRSEAVLTVEDEGIGLDAETARRAFERFYRGPGAQRLDPTGTGLGLSIARWIVERHGGAIVLGSQPPCGTRAVVRIPSSLNAAGDAPSEKPTRAPVAA